MVIFTHWLDKGRWHTGVALLAVALVSMWIATAASAQTFRFNSVSVEGNQRIETSTILNYAGISRGKAVAASELNAAYNRIADSGLFETVELLPAGGRLIIRVEEYPTINRISFEGNRRLRDDALRNIVRSTPRRVYSASVAERDAAEITKAYEQQGRLSATVTPKIIKRDDNRVDLVFEVFEGGVVEIERISFVGNRAYTDRRLRRVLGTKQAGLLRVVISRDTYVADRIEFDKQVLTDFYRSRGYVDFRITSVAPEVSRERNAVFLTFNLQEGQRFRFGQLNAVSDLPEVDSDKFQSVIGIRPGAVYSPTKIENAIARLERLALREGLQFVRVEPRVTRNDRDLTLDVEFSLVRGPRVFVERIDIEGNTTTLDRVVRRQFRTVEGDPFNPREIRESAERIRALGFFGQSEVNAREGSSADRVVIDVDVTEQPTGSLSFGGNYNTADGFSIIASFRERNFLGRGQSLGLSLNTGKSSRQFRLSFAEPAFLGRDLSAGILLSYRLTQDSDSARYDTTTATIRPSLSFPVSENGRLSLNYEAQYTDITKVNTASTLIRAEAEQGAQWSSSVGYTFSYDSRRDGSNPDVAFVASFGQQFAGLGGDSKSIRTRFSLGAETKVFGDDLTLRATVEGGALHFRGDNGSRVTDRFQLGSAFMRGFKPGGIGPREVSGSDDDALGGNYFAVARIEAEFPLGLPEEYGIRGGVFYDVGSLWGLDATNSNVLYEDFSLRSVAGVSLFWDTPIGPLRFNWSRALQKEKLDQEQTFDLTISTQF